MRSVVLVCAVLACAAAELVLQPPLRFELKPPEGYEEDSPLTLSRNTVLNPVVTTSIVMPIDHFNATNTDTFTMRYMYNEQFFGGEGSPIFILVGGEWTINAGWLQTGNMYQMAQENNGYMIYTEHRYYGQSLPYNTFNAETLRFLSANQALEDLAFFIRELKRQARFADSPIVLYGGSYAGNMVIWFKQRYPDLVTGVVSSSGPILGKADFPEYLEVVEAALAREGGEACPAAVAAAVAAVREAMLTADGQQQLQWNFRLCSPLDLTNRLELGLFSGLITWAFSWQAQLARPGTIKALCDDLADHTYGTSPLQVLGGFATAGLGATSCIQLDYDAYVNNYRSGTSESIAWYWQTCTEYGYYQTAPTSGTAFDALEWLDLDFYVDVCQQVFDSSMDATYVTNAVSAVNTLYGGLAPAVEHTVNLHGADDPWHALGVHDADLSDTSPTITVPRASHCFDMQPWLSTDTVRMSQSKADARRIVRSWLQ